MRSSGGPRREDPASSPESRPEVGGILRIGITGPIGCGKSRVASWLAERGARVVDADVVARAVTAPGEPAHDEILQRFGGAVVSVEGTLDRAALGRIVFSDPAALAALEAIVHPAVRPRILEAIAAAEAAAAPAVAIEAIKLVEGGLAELCDEVWLVTCAPDAQRARLLARGTPAADAAQRIEAQAGLVARLRQAATRVLDASGSEADTKALVLAALDDALAGRRRASR